MTAGEVVPIADAMRARTRRRILNHFCMWHAISPQEAIEYNPPSPAEHREFDRLRRGGVIRTAQPGLFWADLAAHEAADERRRHKLVPVVIAASLAAAATIVLFY